MLISAQSFTVNGLPYLIRPAQAGDAGELSTLRQQMDAETEFLDREPGEGVLHESDFQEIITQDAQYANHLFLVVQANEKLVGYARCEGPQLKRLRHQTEFGISILKQYWGFGMGKQLLAMVTGWADANHIRKISLKVLATNHNAIALYQKYGFETEGTLRQDKCLSDGQYYDTLVMGRIHT